MKKNIFLSILLLSIIFVKAQGLYFSDSTQVSLLTCSPGEEAYAKFGHTGIRLRDTESNLDVVFNYGIFSFQTENFYFKFIKGETDYLLGVNQTSSFLAEYDQRNSMVWEQDLNLNIVEKRKLINSLLENLKPENRKYRYNFIFDNCATRPRDKILNSLDGFVRFKVINLSKTYREWVGQYAGDETWLKFGIDLTFGMDADKIAPQYESMFLPIVLMKEFRNTKVLKNNEQNPVSLVEHSRILVDADVVTQKPGRWYFQPFFIFCIILLIGFLSMLVEYKANHYIPIVDSLLLLITGVGGLIVSYLMFFSVHPLVQNNLNILWLNPLNLLFGVFIWFKPLRKTVFYYQLFNLVLLLLALLTLALSIQAINSAVYPIIVLLIIRYTRWVVHIKHKQSYKKKYSRRNGRSSNRIN